MLLLVITPLISAHCRAHATTWWPYSSRCTIHENVAQEDHSFYFPEYSIARVVELSTLYFPFKSYHATKFKEFMALWRNTLQLK